MTTDVDRTRCPATLSDAGPTARPGCTPARAPTAERDPRRRLPHRRHPGRPAAARRHRAGPGPRRLRRAEDHDAVLQALADRISPRILHAPGPARRRSPGSSTSTSPAAAGVRPAAGLAAVDRLPPRPCCTTCRDDRLRPHRQLRRRWPRWPATRGRSGRSAPPARPTRCRSSCPATGWCAPTARSAATSAAPTPSAPC